ncbi:hypothetical protein ACNKHR_02415 [Shigella flexneri]
MSLKSLAEMARAIPPYTELMEWADGQLSITLNLGNFLQLTDNPLYFDAISSRYRWLRFRHFAVY